MVVQLSTPNVLANHLIFQINFICILNGLLVEWAPKDCKCSDQIHTQPCSKSLQQYILIKNSRPYFGIYQKMLDQNARDNRCIKYLPYFSFAIDTVALCSNRLPLPCPFIEFGQRSDEHLCKTTLSHQFRTKTAPMKHIYQIVQRLDYEYFRELIPFQPFRCEVLLSTSPFQVKNRWGKYIQLARYHHDVVKFVKSRFTFKWKTV